MKTNAPVALAPRRQSAFTLVELLTVVAIIGVLAGILIPVVGRVRISARTAQCKSNMRQLGVGLRLYLADHREIMPHGLVTKDEEGNSLSDWIGWYGNSVLGPYFSLPPAPDVKSGKRRVPWCPEIERDSNINGVWPATGYCYNRNFDGQRLTADLAASRTVMFYEDVQKEPGYNGGGGQWYGSNFKSAVYRFAFRHANTGHLLFVDGHVETFRSRGQNKITDYPEYVWIP